MRRLYEQANRKTTDVSRKDFEGVRINKRGDVRDDVFDENRGHAGRNRGKNREEISENNAPRDNENLRGSDKETQVKIRGTPTGLTWRMPTLSRGARRF